jgi:magnesium transporter
MITISNLQHGAAQAEIGDPDAISDILRDPDAVLWVKVVEPSARDWELLDREFDFHYLALDAARRPMPRPEIDFYDQFLYLNFYVLHWDAPVRELDPQMVAFFVGRNFLVTVQPQPLHLVDAIADNWEVSTAEAGKWDVGLLLYAVLDAIVDEYFVAVDQLAESIDALEDQVFSHRSDSHLPQLFAVKKNTMVFRQIVAPERDVLNALLRWDSPLIERQTLLHLQNVYDHLLRILDSLDLYRDQLGNVLDAHLSMTSNRLNQTMKTLTASSIILMGMTLVASIYGMNFPTIPELGWGWGYWWALGVMGLLGAGLTIIFRRIDWL